MALPWLIGGAIAATIGYLATRDDSSSSTVSDKDEREKEAKDRIKQNKIEKIINDINDYQNKQKLYIKSKYGVSIGFKDAESILDEETILKNRIRSIELLLEKDVGFATTEEYLDKDYFDIDKASRVKIISKDRSLEYKIRDTKREIDNLKEVLKELENMKNETLI